MFKRIYYNLVKHDCDMEVVDSITSGTISNKYTTITLSQCNLCKRTILSGSHFRDIVNVGSIDSFDKLGKSKYHEVAIRTIGYAQDKLNYSYSLKYSVVQLAEFNIFYENTIKHLKEIKDETNS